MKESDARFKLLNGILGAEHRSEMNLLLDEEFAAAEERGRRAGVEAMQLGTCRVYTHGCADGRAASEARPNWREYALPHPKRDNCTDWIALAPRDSGKGG